MIPMFCNATYINCEVYFQLHRYVVGAVAIAMVDAATGEPVAKVTVNIPGVELGDDEILVKDYAENEGMLDWLLESGLVEHTGRAVSTGHVTVSVVRLTDRFKQLLGIERGGCFARD
jgi:hypothetical protein